MQMDRVMFTLYDMNRTCYCFHYICILVCFVIRSAIYMTFQNISE